MLVVSVSLESLRGASVQLGQEVRRAGELLVSASVRAACLDADTLKPRPLPKALAARP